MASFIVFSGLPCYVKLIDFLLLFPSRYTMTPSPPHIFRLSFS